MVVTVQGFKVQRSAFRGTKLRIQGSTVKVIKVYDFDGLVKSQKKRPFSESVYSWCIVFCYDTLKHLLIVIIILIIIK